MKRTTCYLIGLIVLLGSPVFLLSQEANPFGNSGSFYGGIGLTTIDEQTFYTINLRPDISIGKFGVGLNVNLLYNTTTGSFRTEEYKGPAGWFKIIDYIRYGHKRDKFYTQVGAFHTARIGHGFIMNHYTNVASYDNRKIGLALDIDFGLAGFETITNNLGRMEIIGGRGYVRPLRPYLDIPIIKNLTFGASYITDVDPDGSGNTDDGFYAYGVDVELPLIKAEGFDTYTYFDWAQLDKHGSGVGFGIEASFRMFAGLAGLSAKLERRLLGKEFLPAYFDAFYEVQRYNPQEDGSVDRKDQLLPLIQEETKGIFGELVGHVFQTIRLVGNYQKLDQKPKTGILHFSAETMEKIPLLALQATYDKQGVETFNDIFTLDDRSIAKLGVGYKIKPYLVLFVDYIYTFQFDAEKNYYKPQKRYSARIAFVQSFSF